MLDFLRANVSADKLVWLTFTAALICVPEFAALGWATHEVVGFTVFGLLPAAVLIDLAVGISAFASDECRRATRRVWFATMLFVVAGMIYVTVATKDAAAIKDAETVFAFVMILLTFPSGLIGGPVALIALEWCLARSGISNGRVLLDFIFWLIMTGLGYFQWFLVVPAFTKAWRRKYRAIG